MSQPYDPRYGGGQQPWGAPGQQAPGGYPQQGYQQPGGYPPPQGGYPYQQQGHPPQYRQPPGHPPQPGFVPPPWQPAGSRRKGSPLGIGIAIAAAIMAIGTLLPWIAVQVQFSSSNLYGTPLSGSDFNRSLAGIKAAEGKIVMFCAVVAIVLGIVTMVSNGKLGLLAGLPAVIAILVILKVFGDKAKYDGGAGAGSLPPSLRSSVQVSLQAGIFISLLMAIAVIGLGVISAVTSKSR
jgi:hypothetical protein